MTDSRLEYDYAGSEACPEAEIAAAGTRPIPLGETPLCRAIDTAYLLFTVPDLDLQQGFLEDFGLITVARTEDRLYMRGYGANPYCYVAERGEKPRYRGMGLLLNDGSTLDAVANATGHQPVPVDGPGGGIRLRLTDPDGFIVDLVTGRAPTEPVPVRRELPLHNTPDEKARVARPVRHTLAPTPVHRFAHCVLMVSDFQASWRWYRHHVGLLPSDVLCAADGEPVGVFGRLDRGIEPADHHSVVLLQGLIPQYMHSAYEALDIDALGQGQQYLRMKGWRHQWGIGRHVLGSQLFDYWLDPWGFELEHYADGDVFDNTSPPGYHPLDRGGLYAWGDDVPDSYRPRPRPRELMALLRRRLNGTLDMALIKSIQQSMSRRPRPWLK